MGTGICLLRNTRRKDNPLRIFGHSLIQRQRTYSNKDRIAAGCISQPITQMGTRQFRSYRFRRGTADDERYFYFTSQPKEKKA